MFSYLLISIRVLINRVLLQRSQFYPKIEMLVDILLLHIIIIIIIIIIIYSIYIALLILIIHRALQYFKPYTNYKIVFTINRTILISTIIYKLFKK